MLQEQIQKKTR